MTLRNDVNVKDQHADVSEHLNDMAQDINDGIMVYLHIYLNTVARTIISVVGVLTNIVNMIIFSKLGLKDSVSVGLFSLSLTDFLVTSIQVTSCICYMIVFLCPDISTEMWYLDFYVFGWVYSTFYEVSCWVTALVSVERCYCVVSPFKVKQIFTRFRCIVVTVTIYAIHISIHAPVYANNRLEWTEIITPSANNTTTGTPERAFAFSVNEEVNIWEFILDVTAGGAMWLLSQAIIVVCAVWMGYSLEASSKVRHNGRYDSQRRSQQSVHSKVPSTLSNRERRLVRVVLILAITLTCCNLPKIIAISMYHTLAVENGKTLYNLSTVMWSVTSIFGSLGCSITFVVYLKLNVHYRRRLIHACVCKMLRC